MKKKKESVFFCMNTKEVVRQLMNRLENRTVQQVLGATLPNMFQHFFESKK